jgi:Rrf2 family protein
MDLAKSQGIPISFGHKILRKLVAAHLVTSRAGRSGGFRLARRPETIRLIDIVTAIQGPVSVSRCMMEINPCLRRATCPVSQKWRKLQRSIITFLRTTTLADIIGAK